MKKIEKIFINFRRHFYFVLVSFLAVNNSSVIGGDDDAHLGRSFAKHLAGFLDEISQNDDISNRIGNFFDFARDSTIKHAQGFGTEFLSALIFGKKPDKRIVPSKKGSGLSNLHNKKLGVGGGGFLPNKGGLNGSPPTGGIGLGGNPNDDLGNRGKKRKKKKEKNNQSGNDFMDNFKFAGDFVDRHKEEFFDTLENYVGFDPRSYLKNIKLNLALIPVSFMLFWWALRSARKILNMITEIFTKWLEFLFYMPALADEKSGFWSMFKIPASASSIMREIDEKLVFDDEVRKQIYVFVEKFVKTATTDTPTRVLLIGPPGSGKTQVAKIVTRRGSKRYMMTSGSTFTKYTPQQAIQEIRRTFNLKKTVVFFDEADMLIGSRATKEAVLKAIRLQLMAYMGDKEKPINIIMTTNDPKNMDGAFRRRFELIIRIPYPSRVTLVKIVKLYFYKKLGGVRISEQLATSIVDRLKSIVAAEVSGAQIERIVDYIRAITIERRKRVTTAAIQEALNGYKAEQISLRENYTGNEEMPPTPGEIFKSEFERVLGLNIDLERAVEIMEDLESMVDVEITENMVKYIVQSIKDEKMNQGKQVKRDMITEKLKECADAQNALNSSYEDWEDALDMRDTLMDLVDAELDVTLSEDEAESMIQSFYQISGTYPTEEILQELVQQAAASMSNELSAKEALKKVIEDSDENSLSSLHGPYTTIPSLKRRNMIGVAVAPSV